MMRHQFSQWRWWVDKICIGMVVAGILIAGRGAYSMLRESLAEPQPQNSAVIEQQLSDHIQNTHDAINRIERRVAKLEDSQTENISRLSALDQKATSTLSQLDKMGDELWGLVIGVILLALEVLARRIFDRRKGA